MWAQMFKTTKNKTSDVQAQDQTKTKLGDQDALVQKPKAQLQNWLVEKIVTPVIEWCALIYWSRYGHHSMIQQSTRNKDW